MNHLGWCALGSGGVRRGGGWGEGVRGIVFTVGLTLTKGTLMLTWLTLTEIFSDVLGM